MNKKLMILLIWLSSVSVCYSATKNIVPRADGEGQLGTVTLNWDKVYAQEFYGDGTNITGMGSYLGGYMSFVTDSYSLLSYLNGYMSYITDTYGAVTDTVQTQLNTKASSYHTQSAETIANGSVSDAEFQYINGVTSTVQDQLNVKAHSNHIHSEYIETVTYTGYLFTGFISCTANYIPKCDSSGVWFCSSDATGDGGAEIEGMGFVNVQFLSPATETAGYIPYIVRGDSATAPVTLTEYKPKTSFAYLDGTVDSTEYGYINGVTDTIQTQLNAKASSYHKQSAETIHDGSISDIEYGYLNGVTDTIQTQLNTKASSSSVIYIADVTASVQTQINAALKLVNTDWIDLTDGGDSTLHYNSTDRARANHTGTQDATTIHDGSVDNTEYGYINGVTGTVQTQLNSKASSYHTQGAATIANGSVSDVEYQYINGVTDTIQTQLNSKASSYHEQAASTIGNKDVDDTELSYINGVTETLQTQLNVKARSNHLHSNYLETITNTSIKAVSLTVIGAITATKALIEEITVTTKVSATEVRVSNKAIIENDGTIEATYFKTRITDAVTVTPRLELSDVTGFGDNPFIPKQSFTENGELVSFTAGIYSMLGCMFNRVPNVGDIGLSHTAYGTHFDGGAVDGTAVVSSNFHPFTQVWTYGAGSYSKIYTVGGEDYLKVLAAGTVSAWETSKFYRLPSFAKNYSNKSATLYAKFKVQSSGFATGTGVVATVGMGDASYGASANYIRVGAATPTSSDEIAVGCGSGSAETIDIATTTNLQDDAWHTVIIDVVYDNFKIYLDDLGRSGSPLWDESGGGTAVISDISTWTEVYPFVYVNNGNVNENSTWIQIDEMTLILDTSMFKPI